MLHFLFVVNLSRFHFKNNILRLCCPEWGGTRMNVYEVICSCFFSSIVVWKTQKDKMAIKSVFKITSFWTRSY